MPGIVFSGQTRQRSPADSQLQSTASFILPPECSGCGTEKQRDPKLCTRCRVYDMGERECARWDSNPHAAHRPRIGNPLRLPIPPRAHSPILLRVIICKPIFQPKEPIVNETRTVQEATAGHARVAKGCIPCDVPGGRPQARQEAQRAVRSSYFRRFPIIARKIKIICARVSRSRMLWRPANSLT